MREDNAFFLFLRKCDTLPTYSSDLIIVLLGYIENLRVPNGTHVIFYKAIVGVSNERSSFDHVDL